MPTVLITGANRGLGLEFARQYAADGWRVIATCREPERAESLKALAGNLAIPALDVTDHRAIEALARDLAGQPIDLLLNNAGVYGPRETALDAVDYAAWEWVFRVNTEGPLKVCACFVDHVARSEGRLMAAVSSAFGSIGGNASGGSYAYRSSKAALNMVMKTLAVELAPRGVGAVVLSPGWVRTDMGGPEAPLAPKESVAGLRAVLGRLKAEDSGRFFGYDGEEIPW